VCAGLKAYFDRALRPVLLYKQEHAQADALLGEEGAGVVARAGAGPLPPSEVYGAEHLLRLFVKLPELLPVGDMDTSAVKVGRGGARTARR
jgi:mortality factor 4-like protein 1